MTLTLGDVSLGQGHDVPLGFGEQFCELSKFVKGLRSFVPEKINGQTDRKGEP